MIIIILLIANKHLTHSASY